MRGLFASSILNIVDIILFSVFIQVCVNQGYFETVAVPGFDKSLPSNFVFMYSQILICPERHYLCSQGTSRIRNLVYGVIWHLTGRMSSPIGANCYPCKILQLWQGGSLFLVATFDFCGGAEKVAEAPKLEARRAKFLRAPGHEP